jgi:phage terminase Nu1 subunit (DNA packaging protein)
MAEGVPAKTLAVVLDMDERVVRRLAAEGIIVRAGRNQYLFAPSVCNYVRHLREVAAGRQGNELNAVDESARLKIAQRRNYDLKNAILERNSIHMRLSRRPGRASSGRSGPRCWRSLARRGSACSI